MLTRAGDAPPAARRPRFSVGRIALAMGAGGLVLIVATAALVGGRERQIATREARMAAESAAYSLADHASRLFEVADLALRTATLSLGDRKWDEAEDSKALWEELRATGDALPYLRDLLLIDADGRLRLATLAFPTPAVALQEGTALQAARGGADGLLVGGPLLGRITGRPSFLVARRLSAADGSFRGIAAATAELDYFRAYWRRVDLPNEAHVALVRPDADGVLVRLPDAPAMAPTSLPALKAAIATAPLAGPYAPAAGRLAFYHRVGDLPLYLTVSYSDAAVAAAWWAWMRLFLLFPTAALLAVVAIMALARRQSRVEARANLAVSRARAALAVSNERLEQRVAERTAALEDSNAEIHRFAYIVSHDLRAPLVNIMGFTSELQRLRGDLFPELAAASAARDDFDEALGFIRLSIDKMDRLIKAILMLAREGARAFQPEPVDMGALMRSVVDGVAHRAAAAGATVTIGPMPTIAVDRVAAEQVFSNLVDNAVKYLRPGAPGTVAVTAVEEAGRVAFRVADDGRGIDPRDHARVFELFRRSGAQDRPGEGIGLAHVKALVRQLGGTIALESTPNAGSAFTVTLPRTPTGGTP